MRGRRFCFAMLAASAIGVAACSSTASTPGYYNGDYANQATEAPIYTQALPAYMNGGGATQGPAVNPGSSVAAAPNASSGGFSIPTGAASRPEDKIIKTGTVDIQVVDLDGSIARATDQIHGLGGWMAGSDRTNSTASGLASVTYRVPVDRFEDALAIMRKLGNKVLGEHTDSQSVASQIVDLQARIDNLKATEKATQSIMDKTAAITDILTVQQRLTDIQGKIEELNAQLTGMTDSSAYSTLTVVFEVPAVPSASPTVEPTPTPEPTATAVAWSASEQINQATGTLSDIGKGVATILIWVVLVLLPITIALLLFLGAGRLTMRLLGSRLPGWLGIPAWQTVPQPVPATQPQTPPQSGSNPTR